MIQKDKLYAKEAHANLRPDVRAAIYAAVDRCVKEGKYKQKLFHINLIFLILFTLS